MARARRAGRHRPEGRGLILLLVWAAAGAAIVAIVLRGAPLGEPAPGLPADLRRPCSLGYVPYGNDEGDVVCVRTTPARPEEQPMTSFIPSPRRTLRRVIADWLLADGAAPLDRLENLLTSALSPIEAAIQRQTDVLVPALEDVRTKIAQLTQLATSGASPEQIAAAAASIDASTDRIAQAVGQLMTDPATPEPTTDIPPEVNPDTPPTVEVPGAVEAGEPLPDSPQV